MFEFLFRNIASYCILIRFFHKNSFCILFKHSFIKLYALQNIDLQFFELSYCKFDWIGLFCLQLASGLPLLLCLPIFAIFIGVKQTEYLNFDAFDFFNNAGWRSYFIVIIWFIVHSIILISYLSCWLQLFEQYWIVNMSNENTTQILHGPRRSLHIWAVVRVAFLSWHSSKYQKPPIWRINEFTFLSFILSNRIRQIIKIRKPL